MDPGDTILEGGNVRDAVIVDAVRTPIGRRNGALADWHPVDLAAEVLTALAARTGLDPPEVDEFSVRSHRLAGAATDGGRERATNRSTGPRIVHIPPRRDTP
jgi:acetyl-CoA acetyltransferase